MHKLRNDIILIVLLVFVAIGGVIALNCCHQDENLKAIVYHKEEIVLEINLGELSEEKEYKIMGELGEVRIVASHNSIRIVESECHDKYCIKQNSIDRVGQVITCLPNRIYIKLEGSGVDVSL